MCSYGFAIFKQAKFGYKGGINIMAEKKTAEEIADFWRQKLIKRALSRGYTREAIKRSGDALAETIIKQNEAREAKRSERKQGFPASRGG
jgi:hypothetical protein